MYYDRGELFTIFLRGLRPADRGRSIRVNQTPPWVNSQVCAVAYANSPADWKTPGARRAVLLPGQTADRSCPMPRQSPRARSCFSFAIKSRQQLPYTLNERRYSMAARRDLANRHRLTSAISAAMKSFPCLSIRLRLLANQPSGGYSVEQDYTYGYSILTNPATFAPATLPNGNRTCKL